MKNISTFINEGSEQKEIFYQNVPVKEFWAACIRAFKKYLDEYHGLMNTDSRVAKLDAAKVTVDALTEMVPALNIKGGKYKFISGQGQDYSDCIDKLEMFFSENWDNNFESGSRYVTRDKYSRYYTTEFNLGKNTLTTFFQMGSLPELTKYKVK